MEATQARQYVAVQGKDEDGSWIDLYASIDEADARGVLKRMREAGVPRDRIRLVEVEVIRDSQLDG